MNDFLPPTLDGRDRVYRFSGAPAVKDAIEAQAVPHPEVAVILVNGTPSGFGYQLRDGDRVSVYPVFQQLDPGPEIRLRGARRAPSRFVVDVNLGKLARWLRLLGYDTLYRNDSADAELARTAAEEDRVLLTRDRRLLHHKAVVHGYWVRAVEPEAQVAEVTRRFRLGPHMAPFRRCLACNGIIRPVPKQRVIHRLEPKTRLYYDEFYQCADCGKIYWKGPHFVRLTDTVQRLFGSSAT